MNTLTTRPLAIALAVASLLMAGACGSSESEKETGQAMQNDVTRSMAAALNDVEGLGRLNSAISGAEFGSVFDGPGSYTLLAPNDAAFEALGEKGASLTSAEQRPLLVAMLRDHMLPGHFTPANIRSAIEAKGGPVTMTTLGGGSLTFALEAETLTASGEDGTKATLSEQATEANNGVIIPVDAVLLEESAE